MRDGKRGNPDEFSFLCPTCFTFLAEIRGVVAAGWLVTPFNDGPVDRAEQVVFVPAGPDSDKET